MSIEKDQVTIEEYSSNLLLTKEVLSTLTNEEVVKLVQLTNDDIYWEEIDNRTKRAYSYVLKKYVHQFYKETMKKDIMSILKIGWVKAVKTYNEEKATSEFIPYCTYIMHQNYVMFARRIDENKIGTSVRDEVMSSVVIDGHENTDKMVSGCLENIMGYENDRYDDIEKKHYIEDMLNRLKEYDQTQKKVIYQVVEGHCLRGITQKELGNKLGMSQSAISRHIRKGLQFLHKEMTKEDIMINGI